MYILLLAFAAGVLSVYDDLQRSVHQSINPPTAGQSICVTAAFFVVEEHGDWLPLSLILACAWSQRTEQVLFQPDWLFPGSNLHAVYLA